MEAAQALTPRESVTTSASMRIIAVLCHACGCEVLVPARGKVGVRYCSPECRPTCAGEGCAKPAASSHGLCWGHYQRLRKYGDVNAPTPPRKKRPRQERPCSSESCGKIAICNGMCAAHASAWRRANNPHSCTAPGCLTPQHASGFCLKHYFRVRKFGDINGTSIPAKCPSGHDFTPENTRISLDKKTGHRSRSCRICHRSKQAKRRAVMRGADAEQVMWLRVMERDDWECKLCGGPIPPDARWPAPEFGSLDHRVSIAKGGRHTYENIQAAHLCCNMSKNDDDPETRSHESFAHLWREAG